MFNTEAAKLDSIVQLEERIEELEAKLGLRHSAGLQVPAECQCLIARSIVCACFAAANEQDDIFQC